MGGQKHRTPVIQEGTGSIFQVPGDMTELGEGRIPVVPLVFFQKALSQQMVDF